VKDDYLTIGNKSYPFYEEMIDNEKLNFYPENPRIYCLYNGVKTLAFQAKPLG